MQAPYRKTVSGETVGFEATGGLVPTDDSTWQETVDTLAETHGGRIIRGCDGEMMPPGMLDDKVAVEDSGEQELSHEAFGTGAAVKKLVGTVDALGGDEGDGPHKADEAEACNGVLRLGDAVSRPEEGGELNRAPRVDGEPERKARFEMTELEARET